MRFSLLWSLVALLVVGVVPLAEAGPLQRLWPGEWLRTQPVRRLAHGVGHVATRPLARLTHPRSTRLVTTTYVVVPTDDAPPPEELPTPADEEPQQ